MKTFITAIFIFCSLVCSFGQNILEDIPDSLKENAHEIILSDKTEFYIRDINSSSLSRKTRVIIKDKYAEDFNSLVLYYDDFTSIAHAEIRIYDLRNNLIEKVKVKDFGDYSTKGFSIAGDNRAIYHEISQNRFPYIAEIEYNLDYTGSMFYEIWSPQTDEHQSVLSSEFNVICENDFTFRYKTELIGDPKITKADYTTKYSWSVKNLPAFEFETFSGSRNHYTPTVYTAPNDFQMDGITGSMNTWQSYGLWQNKVNEGRNTITDENLAVIRKLIPSDASDLDKIRIVYDYLQENTRYVSIQLGIGGWQPFESGYVHQNKYGDCKALSFYTQSLLNALGVKSHYTIIKAGWRGQELSESFPLARFNHVILTIPTEADTIWLECTSQTNPFGYMGTFTSDRNALMVTESGGKLIRTRKYEAEENLQTTLTKVKVYKSGHGSVALTRKYSGLGIENRGFDHSSLKPTSDQLKWVYDEYDDWGDYSVDSLSISPPSDEVVPTGNLSVSLSHKNIATANSNRLFYKPFLFTNIQGIKLPKGDRKTPIEVRYGYTQADSIEVTFPAAFYPENVPEDVTLETKYGSYSRKIVQNENTFIVTRYFLFKDGQYPKEEYEAFRAFIKKVQKYDRARIVMVDKT